MTININKRYKIPLNIEYSPKIKSDEYSSLDKKIADILFFTPSFMKDIYKARTDSGIEKPIEYPTNPTVTDLAAIFAKLKPQKKKLEEYARTIMVKYQLQPNWLISIKTAIATGTLLIPNSLGPVVFVPAGALLFVEQIAKINDPETREYLFAKNLLEAYKYPSLRFTRKTSINGLEKWLKEHSTEFKQLQLGLPGKNEIRMPENNLYWGYIAEMFSRYTDKPNYAKMIERLDELDEYLQDKNDSGFPAIPDRLTLRNYHQSYKKLIKLYTK